MVIAAAALCVAWLTLRRTTQHVVRVVRCQSHYEKSIEHPNGFDEFEVYFKNIGLRIPEMAVALGFHDRNGLGWCSCGLRAVNVVTNQSSGTASNIETGMVVKFGWRTYEMDEGHRALLDVLDDIRKQNAVLSVYNAGYLVKTIRLWSWRGWITGLGYNLIFRLLMWFKMGSFAKNQKSWRARIRLPDSNDMPFCLKNFLERLRNHSEQPH